jgi:hypothetical protein
LIQWISSHVGKAKKKISRTALVCVHAQGVITTGTGFWVFAENRVRLGEGALRRGSQRQLVDSEKIPYETGGSIHSGIFFLIQAS